MSRADIDLVAIAATETDIPRAAEQLAAALRNAGPPVREARVYGPGKMNAPAGIRTRNLEGLGDDWVTLRNVAIAGGSQTPAARQYMTDGAVALALRDLSSARPDHGDIFVLQPAEAPSRLEASCAKPHVFTTLAGLYLTGEAWRFDQRGWLELFTLIASNPSA